MSAPKEPAHKTPVIELRPGQVWTYRARPQEPDSTLTILELSRNIVHIFVENLKIADPLLEDGVVSILSFPIERAVLSACLEKLVREDLDHPDYVAALARFREMHEPGDLSAFDLPLDEFFELTEESLIERALESDD